MDKTKLIGICVLISVLTLLITNFFVIGNFQSLMTLENLDYQLASKTLPILVLFMLIHYSSMAIGLVASFHSQSENNFSDLSKPYLAYLAYGVFVFDVATFALKNWTGN